MKIFIIILSVNLFLSFISVYLCSYYVISSPQIDRLFLELINTKNQRIIQTFKTMDIKLVYNFCELVISAPLFRSEQSTFQQMIRSSTPINENTHKIRTISLIYPDNVIRIVEAFLCNFRQDERIMYISNDFNTNRSFFVYYIQSASPESKTVPVILGLIKKQNALGSDMEVGVFYNNIINKNSNTIEESEAATNFLKNLDQNQAFRLCSLAFTYHLDRNKILLSKGFYIVRPRFVLDNKDNFTGVLWHRENNDKLEVQDIFISFPNCLCCEVKWDDKSDEYCLIPDRNDQKSMYFSWNMVDNFYTLTMHLKNIL